MLLGTEIPSANTGKATKKYVEHIKLINQADFLIHDIDNIKERINFYFHAFFAVST